MQQAATHHRVLTIADSSPETSWCGDWLKHWRYATGSTRDTCAVESCRQPARTGAHVQFDEHALRGHWYVVPICAEHCCPCKEDAPIFIDRRVALLPADEEPCNGPQWWS